MIEIPSFFLIAKDLMERFHPDCRWLGVTRVMAVFWFLTTRIVPVTVLAYLNMLQNEYTMRLEGYSATYLLGSVLNAVLLIVMLSFQFRISRLICRKYCCRRV